MLKKILLTLVCLASFGLAAQGCGTPTKYVAIDSKPQGATVFINGEEKGVTPIQNLQLTFPAGLEQRVIIQVVKDRYLPFFESWLFLEVPRQKKYILQEN